MQARKRDHVALVLKGVGQQQALTTGFESVRFEHVAMPDMHMRDVNLSVTFLRKKLAAPLLISSMTGGFQKGAKINLNLARAAQKKGIVFAVGSQRVALEGPGKNGLDRSLRKVAPDIPVYANLGAAQFANGYGLDEARRAVNMIAADALFIHLNPLQEAVQAGGDLDWSGVLGKVERLAKGLGCPIIVKEVGFGISSTLAKKLHDCGVAAVDVAGAGGTNWALVEAGRSKDSRLAAIAAPFAGWGIPTARAVAEARAACPDLPLIASGGIKDGVDAAKAIRLGADIVGIAAGLLQAATISSRAVEEKLDVIIEHLRLACFCTGSRSLRDLRKARIIPR